MDEAQPLDVLWGLLSSAPYLQHIFITIVGGGAPPDITPAHRIHLNSLRSLSLLSGFALSRVIPYIKAPQLKELLLTLPLGTGAWTIADLLPSNSYPLVSDVTAMDFCGSEISPEGEGTKVTVNMPYRNIADMSDFFDSTTASFSFAQITRLTFETRAGPLALRIGEFTNLQLLDLAYLGKGRGNFLRPFPVASVSPNGSLSASRGDDSSPT